MGRVATITDTVPEPCCIAGTWLRPFCLGHHLLFRRLGIPFADDPQAKADLSEHVLPAVAICAGESFEWTLKAMLEGRWEAIVARWVKDAHGPWWNRRKVDLQGAESLFRAYLADGYHNVPIWRHKKASGVKLGAPWEQSFKCRLVEAGFSESEVLNGYLPARWYDYFTLAEADQWKRLERLAAAGQRNVESMWRPVFYTAEDEAKLKGGQA